MFNRSPWSQVPRRPVVVGIAVAAVSTAAAGFPQQPSQPHQDRPYRVVDASQGSVSQLRKLPKPVPFKEYLRSREGSQPRTVPNTPDFSRAADLRQECIARKAQAASKSGWVKSRFQACFHRRYDLLFIHPSTGQVRGQLWFDVWVLGIATDGERRVSYAASIENIKTSAVPGEDARKWRITQAFRHSISVGGSDPNPKVAAPAQTVRFEPLGSWESRPRWSLIYTSPDLGPRYSQGNAQRVSVNIAQDISADSPTATPYHDVGSFTSPTRFDFAGPVAGKYKGAVFTNARITFRVNLKDPKQNESARHIDDALHHPERTFPSLLGKSVPGEKMPLHRLVDQAKIERNRNKSIATCKDVWGGYPGRVLNCDEFPFASTYEGSATTKFKDRYSVRLIDAADNQHVGNIMLNKRFYTVNRVLDGDPFYVAVDRR